MEKFKVDYGEQSDFKGIRILFDFLEEGLAYARNNNIKEVCVWNSTNNTRQTIDFSFLEKNQSLKVFHWLVPLSKKSNIEGLYGLNNLLNLRWSADCDFAIDLSKISSLEILNVGISHKLFTNWESLSCLKELYIQSIQANDCIFLSGLKKLEKLRIINGNFSSLSGLDKLNNLNDLSLIKCSKLKNLNPLPPNKSLLRLRIEKCKNLMVSKPELEVFAKHIVFL